MGLDTCDSIVCGDAIMGLSRWVLQTWGGEKESKSDDGICLVCRRMARGVLVWVVWSRVGAAQLAPGSWLCLLLCYAGAVVFPRCRRCRANRGHRVCSEGRPQKLDDGRWRMDEAGLLFRDRDLAVDDVGIAQ